MVDKKHKHYALLQEVFKMFEDEKLGDAFKMLDGFPPVIDSFVREEMLKKPLADLPATFL